MADEQETRPLALTDEGILQPKDAADGVAPESGAGNLAKIPFPLQIAWIALAICGFVDNVFGAAGASFPWHPIASALALAWLAFGMVGAMINYLDQVGLPGGAKLSFRKLERAQEAAAKSEVSVEALRECLSDYSGLMQNWANSINLFDEQFEKYAKTDDDVGAVLARYCLGRMEEAREVIGEEGDRLRLSFWWFVEDEGGLKLLFSDDIRDEATLSHVFKPGAGLCGQCYVEDRIYNIPDAPASIYYEKIGDNPGYRGLLLVPVKYRTDGGVIGVLSVDREKKEAFDENASNVASALADLIAYAMNAAFSFEAGEEAPGIET